MNDQQFNELRNLILLAIPACRLPRQYQHPDPGAVVPIDNSLLGKRMDEAERILDMLIAVSRDNRMTRRWPKSLYDWQDDAQRVLVLTRYHFPDTTVPAVPVSVLRNQLSLRSLFRVPDESASSVAQATLDAMVANSRLVVDGAICYRPGAMEEAEVVRWERMEVQWRKDCHSPAETHEQLEEQQAKINWWLHAVPESLGWPMLPQGKKTVRPKVVEVETVPVVEKRRAKRAVDETKLPEVQGWEVPKDEAESASEDEVRGESSVSEPAPASEGWTDWEAEDEAESTGWQVEPLKVEKPVEDVVIKGWEV